VKQRLFLLTLLIAFSFTLLKSQPVRDSIAFITKGTDADTVKIKKLLGLYHHYKMNDPQQALLAAESAGKLANEKSLVLFKAKAFGLMGTANYNMDRYTEALGHYLNALQLYEKLDRKREQGVILSNMGNLLLDQELPDQALPYYQRALVINKDLKLDADIAMDLLNISSAYSVIPKLDSAYLICSQALEKAEELKDTAIYTQCLGNLGIIEFQQKKYDIALKHILEAEDLYRKHGLESNIGVLFLSLGDIYLQKKDVAKATFYYTNALENGKEIESIDDERYAYLGLSKCAELKGNFPQAYNYIKKYNVLNDFC
jgi:tetratricopeptide (TPR) repeat protein